MSFYIIVKNIFQTLILTLVLVTEIFEFFSSKVAAIEIFLQIWIATIELIMNKKKKKLAFRYFTNAAIIKMVQGQATSHHG